MRATRPLFRLDPGWLFILAGLAVCAAGVLLPAQADLRALEDQLALLQGEEARAYQRLAAHADFIDQVDRGEPGIIKRLAAAQLNLVPEGDKPVLLSGGEASPVTEWIDATVDLNLRPPPIDPASTLSRWANGQSRLWMFGGGIMAVFIGLLISPEGSRARRKLVAAMPLVSQEWESRRVFESPGAADATWNADEDDADVEATNATYAEYAALAVEDGTEFNRPDDVHASLPATADIDPQADLQQQEDTVDLEEDELPARTRSVIDDNVAWHNAATVEHAGEVIIEAKEVVAAEPIDTNLPRLAATLFDVGEDDDGGDGVSAETDDRTTATATEDETEAMAGDTAEAEDDADVWSIDDAVRLSETSLLFPTAGGSSEPNAIDASEDEASRVAEVTGDPGGDPVGDPAAPAMNVADVAPAKTGRRKRRRKRDRHIEVKGRSEEIEAADVHEAAVEGAANAPADADDDTSDEVSADDAADADQSTSRVTPKRRTTRKAFSTDDDSAASIPFLRYRAVEDDDADDAAAHVAADDDDDMPVMAADADAPGDDDAPFDADEVDRDAPVDDD